MFFKQDLLLEIELRYYLIQGLLVRVPPSVAEDARRMLDGIPELISLYKRLLSSYNQTYDPRDLLAIKSVLKQAKNDLQDMNLHLKDLTHLVRLEIKKIPVQFLDNKISAKNEG